MSRNTGKTPIYRLRQQRHDTVVVVYFINLLVTDVYFWIAGQSLFQSISAGLTYVLINEPIWFACEVFFAIGLALSVFRDKLLESNR